MLRPVNSELMLDHGFTQDDVDWEAHFTGPDGNGYVLAFRPDLDMAGVASAVADGRRVRSPGPRCWPRTTW